MIYSSSLLIDKYDKEADVIKTIYGKEYTALDSNVPVCRYRGTIVKKADLDDDGLIIVGWQRNITRFKKVDISLPTIITIQLRKKTKNKIYEIDGVELDPGFRGSKGILCSGGYLNRNLKEQLLGKKFDSSLMNIVNMKNMHCFHIMEIMKGALSYFQTIDDAEIWEKRVFYEEEVIDVTLDEEKQINFVGCLKVAGKENIHYNLRINDLFRSIQFMNDGSMTCQKDLLCQYSIMNCETINYKISCKNNEFYPNLKKVLLKCIDTLQVTGGLDVRRRMYYTTLYPIAFIGIMTQALGIKYFNNNYQYIMQILTSIQRNNNIPICIGSIKNMDEAAIYFPQFTIDDVKG